jgi:hypothetical protein
VRPPVPTVYGDKLSCASAMMVYFHIYKTKIGKNLQKFSKNYLQMEKGVL